MEELINATCVLSPALSSVECTPQATALNSSEDNSPTLSVNGKKLSRKRKSMTLTALQSGDKAAVLVPAKTDLDQVVTMSSSSTSPASPTSCTSSRPSLSGHVSFATGATESDPMSFAVILPHWANDGFWAKYMSSPYYAGHIVVAAHDHTYCDGAHHSGSRGAAGGRHRPAPFDTAVVFLQNAEGRRLWPLNDESEAELRRAFLQARGLVSDEFISKLTERGLYTPKKKWKQQ